MRCLISGTAAAASGTFTVTRTISEPASASSMHCRAVDTGSAVSVIVIDWTTTGAPPPTWTLPTRTPTVLCSFTVLIVLLLRRSYHPGPSPSAATKGVTRGVTLAIRSRLEGSFRQMTVSKFLRPVVLMSALAVATPLYAQSVTTTDIQRLQDQVYDTGNEVSRLRSRDQSTADRLQSQLDDLRDEVVYLRVKLRKEGSVSRSEYNDVRTRVEAVRTDARNDSSRQGSQADTSRQGSGTWSTGSTGSTGSGSSSGSGSGYGTGRGSGGYGTGSTGSGSTGSGSTGSGSSSNSGVYGGTQDQQRQSSGRRNEIPSGQEVDVRIERELSSETAQVEDRFTATTMVDLYQGNDVLIPAGSTMRGVVSSVNKATRTDRKGSLTVAFDQVTIRGRAYPMRGTVTQALESEGIKGEAGKIGAGAGVGAILGGILGGAKGALLGILIGGGGTIAATEGKDVALPAGTVLRVRFDQPLQIR